MRSDLDLALKKKQYKEGLECRFSCVLQNKKLATSSYMAAQAGDSSLLSRWESYERSSKQQVKDYDLHYKTAR